MKFKFVSLISGGKDSVFNTMKCVAHGHELICVANLYSQGQKESDSYMYQTVGTEIVEYVAKCLDVPFHRREIKGVAMASEEGIFYSKTDDNDEVEDLFEFLKEIKEKHPEVQAVASGAIFSNY